MMSLIPLICLNLLRLGFGWFCLMLKLRNSKLLWDDVGDVELFVLDLKECCWWCWMDFIIKWYRLVKHGQESILVAHMKFLVNGFRGSALIGQILYNEPFHVDPYSMDTGQTPSAFPGNLGQSGRLLLPLSRCLGQQMKHVGKVRSAKWPISVFLDICRLVGLSSNAFCVKRY